MPSNRMHRGLVALSASAVAAVYLAGYLRTQSADASIEAASVATPAAVAAAPAAPAPAATRHESTSTTDRNWTIAQRLQGRHVHGHRLEPPR
jgi:hypothetical protein